MNVDATISIYEIIATILAFFALVQPWIIKWWMSYFNPLKLSFIRPKKISLFYNKSGSYVYIDGVIESKNRSIVVRDIEVKIVRDNNKTELNLDWSTFRAPVFQQIGNNSVVTNEVAHPFVIAKDTLIPVYTEFALANQDEVDQLECVYNEMATLTMRLVESISNYDQVKAELEASDVYKRNREKLLENFYWKEGKYYMDLIITYNDDNKKTFRFCFDLNGHDSARLKANIEKALLIDLNMKFGKTISLNTLQKEIY